MFGLFKKKPSVLVSPVKGRAIPSSEVEDPTFAEEMLGPGMAFVPQSGEFYSPVEGTVEMVFDTKHAISFTTSDGAEVLLHVGLDTVELQGEPFDVKVAPGDKVKPGDLIMIADLAAIEAAGKKTTTPLIICNPDEFSKVQPITGKEVNPGDAVLELTK